MSRRGRRSRAPWMVAAVLAIAVIVLGAIFLWFAFKVYRTRDGRQADRAAKQMFLFSIFYLFALFAVLLGEKIADWVVAIGVFNGIFA